MLSSVVNFFTPGGRRRSAEADHVDQGVAQENDAVQDVAGVDDAAVIDGVDTAIIAEDVDGDSDGLLEAGGTLTVSDLDAGEESFDGFG